MLKDISPAVGLIYWVHCMIFKLKTTVLTFQEVPEIMASPLIENTFASYLALCKDLNNYKMQKYNNWLEQNIPIMEKTINMYILKVTDIFDRKPPVNRANRTPSKSNISSTTFSFKKCN